MITMEIGETGSQCCVYAITNSVTLKSYVGSTTRRHLRWSDHIRMLRQNRHHAPKLQASYNRHGERAFSFVVLEECSEDQLSRIEQEWLDEGDCFENGYNTLEKVALTDPAIQKARVAKKWADPEQRASHSQRMKALWQDPERRASFLSGRNSQ